jgi:hypothetical protein
MAMRMRAGVLALCGVAVSWLSPASAAESDGELAKKLNNPISDLVSMPLQFNWEFGNGPDEDTWHVQNFQPVVPFHITDHTNMIARLIMPSVSTPGETIAGDMVFSLFFSPAAAGSFVWGVGPVLQLPRTGEKWGIGPTAIVLKQEGPWTYGALVNHVASFAGDDDAPDLNQTFLQPFLAHTGESAVTFTIQSESTANWEAPSGEEWSIPLNVVVSKVARFGPFPASYGAGAGVYLASPDGGPEWKLRSTVTLMLPSAK